MVEGDDQLAAPSKEQLDQEKQLLLAFKPVMQKFLHDHTELQVSALYALQVHCNTSSFPKGTVSRRGDRRHGNRDQKAPALFALTCFCWCKSHS